MITLAIIMGYKCFNPGIIVEYQTYIGKKGTE